MASSVVNRAASSAIKSVSAALLINIRSYAKIATGTDILSAASNVSLQKARTWDDGVSSNFSTTPIKDIFKVSSFSIPDSKFQIPFFFQLLMSSFFPFFNSMLQDKKVVIFGLPVS